MPNNKRYHKPQVDRLTSIDCTPHVVASRTNAAATKFRSWAFMFVVDVERCRLVCSVVRFFHQIMIV